MIDNNYIDVSLKEIVKQFYQYNEDVCWDDDLDLIDDLHFDSIVLVQLIIEIEDKFNISFSGVDISFSDMRSTKKLSFIINDLLERR